MLLDIATGAIGIIAGRLIEVGAWITSSCRSPSQKESTIHTSSQTFLPVTTAHSASY
uniref:Uncharacterized protein n=1 Tax=Aegilops tauschii subsp. strangulata TaxID=200361 RepID=A0A453FQV0_AEGTS